ncbi:MAG: UPF0280 family protein [Thermodesulfobacteriota bacterium]
MEPVQVIREDLVLVDWGPMTLTIAAWAQGRPRPVMAAQAARLALRCLATLAEFQGYLRVRVGRLPPGRPLPPVVAAAAQACRLVGPELTPLAAVAGAVADRVADFALSLGADRVVVNNGGDLALRLAPGQRLSVGLRPPAQDDRGPALLLGRLRLEAASGVGGVASSGWQGRSLSSGVAEMATAWAPSAALADAAATALGNATRLECRAVQSQAAEQMDASCGLGRQPVTTAVGALSRRERGQALSGARRAAQDLHAAGLIYGCLVLVQGDALVLDRSRCLSWQGGSRPAA